MGWKIAFAAAVALSCAILSGQASAAPIECKFSGPKGAPESLAEWRVFLLHRDSNIHKLADANCDGELQLSEIRKYENGLKPGVDAALKDVERRKAAGLSFTIKKNGETVPPLPTSFEPSPEPECASSGFLLRDSYEDISIFGCPKPLSKVSGATFGFSSDDVLDNDSWSAKGVATFANWWMTDTASRGPYFLGYALAPAVKFQRLTNSAESQKSKEVDILSFSGTGELAFANLLGGNQYLRARGAYNTNFEGDPRSWSVTGEWQPQIIGDAVSISAHNGLGPLTWRLDPILRVQYNEQIADSNIPIFADHHHAVRVGPVLALTIQPKHNELYVPAWLQPSTLFFTYEYLSDLESDRDYDLFTANLTLPIDEAGHFGLKFSYQTGDVEETGQPIDLTQIGLTAKW